MSDETYMSEALRLAAKARGQTSPGPMVGSIVVDAQGTVVGRGAYTKPNPAHAEAIALQEAGPRALGGTLYVSLEPCSHTSNERATACADLISAAGISRVISAMEDPDDRERGTGFERLREKGVTVEVGLGGEEARQLNRAYIHHRSTGRPFVTLKMAQTLDGTIAAYPGQRLQLTGKRAASYTRSLRYEYDAVMVGVGTVVVDNPQLTVRPFKPRPREYTRIIVDASGRIPIRSNVTKHQQRARTIVATTDRMPQTVRDALTARDVTIMTCARSGEDRVDLSDLLSQLGKMRIVSVLCEGGATLGSSLLECGHVGSVDWLIAPRLLGGPGVVPVIAPVARNIALRFATVRKLGDDVLVTGEVVR